MPPLSQGKYKHIKHYTPAKFTEKHMEKIRFKKKYAHKALNTQICSYYEKPCPIFRGKT